jgi:ABC-type transporter Mla subunit MlaD
MPATPPAKISHQVKNRQNRRLLAGVGIMIAVATFCFVVFFLADLRALLERRFALYAVFPTAPRLRVGSSVWISGHRVGRVTKIDFRSVKADTSALLAVKLELPRKHRALVPRGSTVRISSARLVGEPVVDILPGRPDQPPVSPGDTLFAGKRTARRELSASLQNLQHALDELQNSMTLLRPLVAVRQKQYAGWAAQVDALEADFAALRQRMAGGSLEKLLNDDGLADGFGAVGRRAQQLGPAFQSAAARYNDPALRATFGRMQERVATLSVELQRLRAPVGNGTLPRFAQDSALTRALHQAQIEMDSLIAETRRNPLRFWLGR